MFKIITAKSKSGEPIQVIKLPEGSHAKNFIGSGINYGDPGWLGDYDWVVLSNGELAFWNDHLFKKEYEVIEQEITCKPYCSRICLKQTDENFIPKLSFVALYRCPDCGTYYLAQRRGVST